MTLNGVNDAGTNVLWEANTGSTFTVGSYINFPNSGTIRLGTQQLNLANVISGSGTLTLTTTNVAGNLYLSSLKTTMTNPLVLAGGRLFGTTGANPFGTSPTFGSITVAVNASQASEVRISPSSGSGQSLAFGNPFNINGNVTFGDAAGYVSTVTSSGTTTFANTPTLTVHAPTTFQGQLSGTGFTKAGAQNLTLVYNASTNITGTVTNNDGMAGSSIGIILQGSGANSPLPGVTAFSLGANSMLMYTTHTSNYIEDASFTGTGMVTVRASGGVSFNPTTANGIANYAGGFNAESLSGSTTPSISFGEFPTSTSRFNAYQYVASSTSTYTFNAAGSNSSTFYYYTNSVASGTLALTANVTITLSGPVQKQGAGAVAATLLLNGTGNGTLSGLISQFNGTIAVTKSGTGTWNLSNSNTYTGATTVSQGTLQINTPLAVQNSTVIPAGGTVAFNYPTINNATFGHLRGSGNLALPGTTTNGVSDFTLTLGGNNEDNSAGGREYSGVISGSGNLVKVGSTDIRLSGTNTFTGTIYIDGSARPANWGSIWVGQGGATGNIGNANNPVVLQNNGSLGMYRTGTLTVASVSGTGWLWPYGTSTGASTLEVLSIDGLTGACTFASSDNNGATYIGNLITTNNINDVGNITIARTGTVGTWTKRGSKTVTVVGGPGVMNINVEAGTLNVTGALTSTSGTITVPSTANLTTQANISKSLTLSGSSVALPPPLSGSANLNLGAFNYTTATANTHRFGNEAGNTVIRITPGMTVSAGILQASTVLGANTAIYMTGGTLAATNTTGSAATYSYLNSTTGNAYAYLWMSGGTYQTGTYLIMGSLNPTTNDNCAVWEVTGPVTWNTNYLAVGYANSGGTGAGSYAVHLRSGAAAPATITTLWLGESNGTGNQYAALTLEDTPLTVSTSYLVFNVTSGLAASNAMAFLSVKNTTLTVPNIEGPATPGIFALTLSDASTLAYTGGASAYHDAGIPVDLFGNNTISVASGTTVSFSGTLVSATGQGVATIPVATNGSGYIGTPVVRIVRGAGDTTGRGATARALVDLDTASPTYGQLLSVVVVSGGHRYTQTPVVSLVGGIGVGGTAATLGTPTMSGVTTGGGFNKTGVGRFNINATSSELTGPVTLTGGILSLGQGTFVGNPLPSVTQYNLPNPNSATEYRYISIQPNTGAFSYPAGTTFSGPGNISIASNLAYTVGATTPGTVFPAGSFTTTGREFNGNATVITTGLASVTSPMPASGLDIYANNSTQYTSTTVTLNDLPTRMSFTNYAPAGTGNTHLKFVGNNPPPYTGTSVDFIVQAADATLTGFTNNLYADQASGSLIIGNGATAPFQRWGMNTAAQPMTLQLRGSSTADNEIRADISEVRGVLRINKTDAGKWWLTGNNTYTGDTRVILGTLVLGSQNALGKSTLDWTNTDSGSLVYGIVGGTNYTLGGLKATATGRTFTVPAGFNLRVGNNGTTNTFGSVLASADNTATITFTGGSSHAITNTANTFNGTLAVENGASAITTVTTYSGITTYSTTTSPLASVQNIQVSGPYIGTTYTALWDLLISTTSQTIATNITVNDDALYGMIHYGPSGATSYTGSSYPTTYTGTISGTGWFVAAAFAYGGAVLNTNRLVEARSSTLPAGLWLSTNGVVAGQGRWANYGYLGPARADGSNFLSKGIRVDNGDSVAGLFGHAFIHRGTGAIVISGGIDKKSSGTSPTNGPVIAATLIFDNTDLTYTGNQDITIQGVVKQTDSGVLSLQKNGNHKLTLSGLSTFGGSLTISAGTVTCAAGNNVASGLGGSASTGAIALTGGTLDFDSVTSTTVNRSAAALQLTTTPTIRNTQGDNEFKVSTVALSASTTFNMVAGRLTLTNTSAIPASTTATSITKTGAGTLRLNHAGNLYVGPTVIRQGTVEITKLAVAGAVSSLGQPATAQASLTTGADGSAGIRLLGTTADTTDRAISFQGGTGTTLTLDSSGTSLCSMTWGGAVTWASAGLHTLELTGTNPTANTNKFTTQITDGSGTTSLLKSGANSWNVQGTVSYTGSTTVTAGTLDFADAAAEGRNLTLGSDLVLSTTGSVSTTTLQNGLTETSANKVLTFLNGSTFTLSGSPLVRANLAGTGLTVNFNYSGVVGSAIKLQPLAGNNTGLAGNATVAASAKVTLVTETITSTTDGDVTGGLNLQVNGTIQIPTGTKQRGRVRYNGNVTIGAGAQVWVGGEY